MIDSSVFFQHLKIHKFMQIIMYIKLLELFIISDLYNSQNLETYQKA